MEHVQLLRTPQAAEFLGLSAKTLIAWRFTGNGPAYRKLGRAVRYDPRDLTAFVERSRRTSTSDCGQGMTGREGGTR
jgi:predicted DNA-binding transcriptional regulator AlpA